MNIWTTLQGAAHQLAQAQSGYVAAALALYIFSVIVTAVRWRVILSTLGCRLGLTGTLVPYLCGVSVGNLTPARTLGADACRLAVLRARHGTPTRVAAASVFYDRLSEIPAIVVLALAATPAVWVLVSESDRYLIAAAFAVAAISGIMYFSTVRRRVRSRLSSWHDRLVGTPIDPAGLGVAVGLSGLVWLQDVARLMLVSAAFRVTLTPSQSATLSVVTLAGGIVPTVGGLGVVESGLVGGLTLFGVPLHVAVAITAAERAVSYVFGTCAGAVTLVMVGGRRVWTAAQGRARLAAPAALLIMLVASPAWARGEGRKPADLAATLARLEAVLRTDPGNLQAGARYRLLAVEGEEYDRAIHFLKGLAAEHRSLANAQITLAFAYIDKVPVAGRIRQGFLGKDAIEALGRAIALDRNWVAYYMRGVINLYYARAFNRVRPAIADLEQALAIQKEAPRQAYHVRTFITLGDAYWKLGDLRRARAVWSDGLRAFSGDPPLTARLACEGRALEDLIEASLDANKRQDTSLHELLGQESKEE